MRPLKENSPHDLYLRAPSASKPLAPLKLYANITGKFTVERDLDTIKNEIRSSTQNAEKSRQERTTVMLDTPPSDLSQTSRKRKVATSAVRKPTAPVRSSATAARAPSPLPPPPSSSSPHRTAVVKALAIKERTFDELLRLLPSEDSLANRKQILQSLLDEVAEKASAAKLPTLWRLKPTSWVEVRPWDWHDLSDQERTVLARTARLTFGNLNIPETDPVWAHVVYRKTGESLLVPASSSVSKADPRKRGVSSKEAKEKKMKPKADPKAEIMMRDESKPVAGPSGAEERPRKGPGSGFRISKPSDGEGSTRSKPGDPRREPAPMPSAKLAEEKKLAAPRIKKREPDGDSDVKESLKRKKPQDIESADVSSAPKRRKMDPSPASRDLSLPKKPEVAAPARPSKSDASPASSARPAHKSKSEGAALPPARSSLSARPTPGSHSSKTGSHRSSAANLKRRERRSPIYTSSEDEGEVSSRKEAPLPTPPSTTSHHLSTRLRPQPTSRPPHTDRDSLRATYKATYRKYLSSYQQLFAQQSKLESLLGDGRSLSDSEGDVEVLSPEETMKLKADYKRWEKELVNIRSIFERGESSE
ncbi:hypothetical protein C8F01DRAFT_1103876 [Mycena amicta]|nr:hypothetical protein C8F01DRAFT_1103876 [Mycena amicta]